MQAIRSLNIRAKYGDIVTVPKDEVWKVWPLNGATFESNFDIDMRSSNRDTKPVILGGGYKVNSR